MSMTETGAKGLAHSAAALPPAAAPPVEDWSGAADPAGVEFPPDWRQRGRGFWESGRYWSGAAWIWRRWRARGGVVILRYQSVAGGRLARFIEPRVRLAPQAFAAQLRFLAEHRRVVALGEVVADLAAGRPLARGGVAVTFDGSYFDTLAVAAPLLAEHGLPATVYVDPERLVTGEPSWADRLYTAFAARRRDRLELLDDPGGILDLADPAVRRRAYGHLWWLLATAGHAQRAGLLTEVELQLDACPEAPRRTLTPDDLRQLARRYPLLEVGLMAAEPLLPGASRPAPLVALLQQGLADLARTLGRPVRHVAFAGGRLSSAARAAVVQLGLCSAVTTAGPGLAAAGADRYALTRLNPRLSLTRFRLHTA